MTSPECTSAPESDIEFVQDLYLRLLGRPADDAGLQWWVSALRSGTSHVDVAIGLAQSPEAIARTNHGSGAGQSTGSPHSWAFEDVVDADPTRLSARTYLEQRDLRRLIETHLPEGRVASACEIGCGFGRMTILLTEFADEVVGFEREKEFVERARSIHRGVDFRQVESLSHLRVENDSFDLAVTFTVLQHLVNAQAFEVVGELKRVLRGDVAILVEETDPDHVWGSVDDPGGACTIGRPVEVYQEWMHPFVLVEATPREIEADYPRADVGEYMVFRRGSA